ncbi:MAG: helix-turn-helix transcriptional regulator [Planctomycetes bacterium]|nr:helix-turn-helix transcriptional regulator [Planctomycetota bacterium]
MPKEQATIAQRLHLLLHDRSQSDLARSAGTSVANVNRYLRGRRVPADFCAALARNAGVNPAWLLTGEGAASLADAGNDTRRMAGDVLELVQALNAVSRMRLGALAGKHHLRVMRELNEALQTCEALRERLNSRSAPVFSDLLNRLEAALQRRDFDRADELGRACEQVQRLCDAPELSRRFFELRAHYEFLRGRPELALPRMRELVRLRVADGRELDAGEIVLFRRLAQTAMNVGRCEDALRTLEAFRALAGPALMATYEGIELDGMRGLLMTDRLRLQDGLDLARRVLQQLRPGRREAYRAAMLRAEICAGLLSLDEAAHIGAHVHDKIMGMLEAACWTEDAAVIERVLAYARKHMGATETFGGISHWAEGILVSRRKRDGLQHYLKNVGEDDDNPRLYVQLAATALALHDDNKPAARRHHALALSLMDRDKLHGQTRVMVGAILHRNTLRLGTQGPQHQAALDFFAQAGQAGYTLLQP